MIGKDLTPHEHDRIMAGIDALERIASAAERFLELIDTPSVTRHDALNIIGECAGAVSLCWDPTPTGVFDAESAAVHVESALSAIFDGRT